MPSGFDFPDRPTAVPTIADNELLEELELVLDAGVDKPSALRMIARIKNDFPKAWKKRANNHRVRPDKQPQQPHNGREPYTPVFGKREILRTLTLDAIDLWERESGRTFTDEERLKSFLRAIILLVLNRNSYFALIAMMQIICGYPPEALIALYPLVDPDRSSGKNASTCSRTKNQFLEYLKAKCPITIDVVGNERRIRSRAPRNDEPGLVADYLKRLLPSSTVDNNCDSLLRFWIDLLDRSRVEMSCIEALMLVEKFDALAKRRSLGPFKNHLRIPVFSNPPTVGSPGTPTSDGSKSAIEIINELADSYRRRAEQFRPEAFKLRVDNVDYDLLGSFSIPLSSVVLHLIGIDHDGKSEVLDTFLIGRNQEFNSQWVVELDHLNRPSITIRLLAGPHSFDVLCEEGSFRYVLCEEGSFHSWVWKQIWQAVFSRDIIADETEETLAPKPYVCQIVGHPGSGKTTLATALIRRLVQERDNTAIFLESGSSMAIGSRGLHRDLLFVENDPNPFGDEVVFVWDAETYSRHNAASRLKTITNTGSIRLVVGIVSKADLDPIGAADIARDLREVFRDAGLVRSKVLCVSPKEDLLNRGNSIQSLVDHFAYITARSLTKTPDLYFKEWNARATECVGVLADAFAMVRLWRQSSEDLATIQERSLRMFLDKATERNVDLYPAPRPITSEERRSRWLNIGALSVLAGVTFVHSCFPFVGNIVGTIAGFLLARLAQRYGWSRKLTKEYERAGLTLSLKRNLIAARMDSNASTVNGDFTLRLAEKLLRIETTHDRILATMQIPWLVYARKWDCIDEKGIETSKSTVLTGLMRVHPDVRGVIERHEQASELAKFLRELGRSPARHGRKIIWEYEAHRLEETTIPGLCIGYDVLYENTGMQIYVWVVADVDDFKRFRSVWSATRRLGDGGEPGRSQ